MRFPDPSGSAGVGMRQEVLMLTRALSDSGGVMRSVGPGPQQLVARWTAGRLNAAEKVAVLLGGAAFHDPALLRIYDEASRDPDRRVLQAAVAGFFALIGDDPPLPSTVSDTAAERERFGDLVRTFGWALRSKPLVGIWVDSFAAGRGLPMSGRLALRRRGPPCLPAERREAAPGPRREGSSAARGSRGSGEMALTNDDVVTMLEADLGDDLVIAKIQQAPQEALNVSPEALVRLKKQGVPKAVLDAMLKRASPR